jgi:TIR domain
VGHFGAEQVFLDYDSLRPADDYPSKIRDQIRASDILLVIISPEWLELRDDNTGTRLIDRENYWVRGEIKDALSLGIFVMPVLVDDTDPLRTEDLPEDIASMRVGSTAELSRLMSNG